MAPSERGVPRWALAALLGVGPAAVVAQLPGAWPALALAAGVPAVVAGVFLLGGERKYYSAAGSAYVVALGVLGLLGVIGGLDADGAAVSLLVLGVPSAAIVAAIYWGEGVLEGSLDDRDGGAASAISHALTAVTAYRLARSAFAIGRTAVYAGVVVLVGTATFGLGALGVAAPLPVPGVGRVDAVFFGFVVAVLVGFHGLAMAHTTWLAARDVVETGREARRVARERTGRDATRGAGDADSATPESSRPDARDGPLRDRADDPPRDRSDDPPGARADDHEVASDESADR